MKRMLAVLVVLVVLVPLGAGAVSAQTRVSVSLSFGQPFVAYHPRPYHGYRYHRYYAYYPRPTIVVVRPYRLTPLIVARSYPRRNRRHYHGW